jgi:TrpR-related protein YerC/YecD
MEKFRSDIKINNLFKAILSLKTAKEVEAFFRDLCTLDEIKEMSERLEIAKLLDKKIPYREIAEQLKVSTTTVSRVALWLNNGTNGYRLILERLAAHSL